MDKEELLEYIEINSGVKDKFMEKALDYQNEKNQKRPFAKRWNKTKVERAADKMYDQVLTSIYDKLKNNIKSSDSKKWAEFIEENNVLEDLEDSMSDITFE
ncbi:hypothetical protein [Pediococcus pentosaceus]|uniref:hypothetical protein n=1 Tax=Pediococcus pentosaceus TaxID=1255 RepID=UPI001C1E9C58|nr:hypothetical protein [Pediococcus pentosaceus]MBU7003875.1 hypothetical protein [Pediococcus pentosaceus]MCG9226438.1 hypothetical protein [Pediococcus pentosaceus]MCM6793058.1 hypothetical protein [Pediococcus pentosaceus]